MSRRADRRRTLEAANVAADGIDIEPRPTSRSRRRRRRGGVVLAGAAAVAAVAGGWWATHRVEPGPRLADPHTVELPAKPKQVAATQTYLQGPGAPILALLELDPLTGVRTESAPSTARACRSLAPRLEKLGAPLVLRQLGEKVPDADTADMVTSYLDSVVVFLTSCAQGEPVGQGDLAFRATVLERRLAQLEVR